MNIIRVDNNKIANSKINNDINLKDNICIDILNNTNLYIEINDSNKVDVKINIKKDKKLKLFNFSETSNSNIKFYITQEENTELTFNSFYKNVNVEEETIIDLNGMNSNVEYNYSCLGNTKKYLKINHNFSNTNSIVKSHAVSKNDVIQFEIIEYVPKKSINCNLSQSSKIINLGDNKCLIKPILLIDEEEVKASHSSVITPISSEDLLYLMSRGINKDNSIRLLVNGFLINNLNLKEEEKHILYEKHVFRR